MSFRSMRGGTMTQRHIVGLTGFSGAGKSTAARHAEATLLIPHYGIGIYERERFGYLGSPPEYHRRLGTDITYYGLYPEHLRRIKRRISDMGILVESFYAMSFVDLLRDAFPDARISVVHVTASRDRRIVNYTAKTGIPADEAARQLDDLDEIKVGFGLMDMIRHATATVHNSSDLTGFLRNSNEVIRGLLS
jgi:hypothetical protein